MKILGNCQEASPSTRLVWAACPGLRKHTLQTALGPASQNTPTPIDRYRHFMLGIFIKKRHF